MTLDDLYKTITPSTRNDWNVIPCGDGPSYRNRFSQVESGGKVWLEHESYGTVAALRKDLSITLACGFRVGPFDEPWVRSFPDPQGHRYLVDLFYMGALVARRSYVSVDGGRASLPIPDNAQGVLTVPRQYSALVRLVDSIEGTGEYDDYLRRASFREI